MALRAVEQVAESVRSTNGNAEPKVESTTVQKPSLNASASHNELVQQTRTDKRPNFSQSRGRFSAQKSVRRRFSLKCRSTTVPKDLILHGSLSDSLKNILDRKECTTAPQILFCRTQTSMSVNGFLSKDKSCGRHRPLRKQQWWIELFPPYRPLSLVDTGIVRSLA